MTRSQYDSDVAASRARGDQRLTLQDGRLQTMLVVQPVISRFTPGPIPLPFEPTRQSAGYFDCCHKEAT